MRTNETCCDMCGKKIALKNAWVTMWVMPENEKTKTPIEMKHMWVTCHPSVCIQAKGLQNTPRGIQLYDHHAVMIASDAEHFAVDYNAAPELMLKILIRLAPLIRYPRPEKC